MYAWALHLVHGVEGVGRVGGGEVAIAPLEPEDQLVARARGYGCLLVVPDDTSGEKLAMMRALGAEVEVVKPAPIASEDNAVNVARRRAKERPGSVFCDQVHETWLGIVGAQEVVIGAKSAHGYVLLPAQKPQP